MSGFPPQIIHLKRHSICWLLKLLPKIFSAEAYTVPCQTSKIQRFAKIVK